MFTAYLGIVLALLAAVHTQKTDPSVPPRPVDCALVQCAWPNCEPGTYATTVEGNCCPTCEKCPTRLLPCPLLVCQAIAFPEDDPCGCPTCTIFTDKPTETAPPTSPPRTPPPPPPPETTSPPTASAETTAPPPTTPTRERVIPTTDSQNDICLLESDRGPCRGKMLRYYFNSETGQCEMFTYGGCRGNDNNFLTLKECQRTCMSSSTSAATPRRPTGDTGTTPRPLPPSKPIPSQGTTEPIQPPTKPSSGSLPPTKPSSGSLPPTKPSSGGRPTRPPPNKPSEGSNPPTRPPTKPLTSQPPSETVPTKPPSVTIDPPSPETPETTECEIRGQVFIECGSACPAVCGEEPPMFCTLQCVMGCQCPSGTSLNKATAECVTQCPTATEATPTTETTEPDVCTLPKDKGSCKLKLRRYYYNARRNECRSFRFGGCEGNANRFDTYAECQEACMCKCLFVKIVLKIIFSTIAIAGYDE